MLINYLNSLKTKGNFTTEAISNLSGIPEPTVKNIFSRKTEDPRFETVSAIVQAMGGSLDEIYNPGKKDCVPENSVLAIKEMYEFQIASMKETNEAHINNIRAHYEQHHEDLKENFERRLTDKREHIKTLERENKHAKILAWISMAILIGILVAEVMNPNLGWLRY